MRIITLEIFLREQIACLNNTNNILYIKKKKRKGGFNIS